MALPAASPTPSDTVTEMVSLVSCCVGCHGESWIGFDGD